MIKGLFNFGKSGLVLLAALMALSLAGCRSGSKVPAAKTAKSASSSKKTSQEQGVSKQMIYAHVNGQTLSIQLTDNSSAAAFKELLEKR